MVEGARLESVYTGNCIEGSNPSVSALNPICFTQSSGFIYQLLPGPGFNLSETSWLMFFPFRIIFYKPGYPEAAAESHQPGLQENSNAAFTPIQLKKRLSSVDKPMINAPGYKLSYT